MCDWAFMRAVIPAAGLGTRFLPYTKAQPKEMLPVVDKPAIQYVVEEAVASGLKDIIIVTGRSKRAIEDHFDANVELSRRLRGTSHGAELRSLERLRAKTSIAYVRQAEPLGLGDAVLCAAAAVDESPFALLLGDDVLVGNPPCTKQLIREFRRTGGSVVAIQEVPRTHVPNYGMVVVERSGGGLVVTRIREKPRLSGVTSNFISIGRYVLTPGIFPILRRLKNKRRKGEIQLTDAIQDLLKCEDVHAVVFRGKRYDIGSKLGWLQATVELAVQRQEYRDSLLSFLKTVSGRAPDDD